MLGICYAENEEDKKAIYCLKKAVDLDPYNIEAQLVLGISYLNDMNTVGALTSLKNWMLHNPIFQHINIKIDEYSDGTMTDDVMQLMLKAHEVDENNADINIVLGVLYNVSMNYDSALSHFLKALEYRSDDYSLLNKIGATLANNMKSEQATEYYAKALQIRPSYVRGWVNLGISYLNMDNNATEAVQALLQAINLAPERE